MNKCDECGAPMRYLSPDTVMCSRTYELALKRYIAGDERTVSHESLSEDPLVISKETPGARPRA